MKPRIADLNQEERVQELRESINLQKIHKRNCQPHPSIWIKHSGGKLISFTFLTPFLLEIAKQNKHNLPLKLPQNLQKSPRISPNRMHSESVERQEPHYKNDTKYLISLLEEFKNQKLNEISGHEFVSFLSVPGISKIQKKLKNIKNEIMNIRRIKKQHKGKEEAKDLISQ